MSKIEFISNTDLSLSTVQLLETDYPEMISEKYSYDFSIEINGNTFFECGDNSFTLIEFLQAVIRWAYRKDDLLYHSMETDDNPLISFVREDDGLYSIHSPWQLFKCDDHFSFEQLIRVLDLVNVKLTDSEKHIYIEKEDYAFLVDIDKTKEYYHTHTLCDCSACRNYHIQIADVLPSAAKWLKDFGVDISRPDETIWFQNDDGAICYDSCYTVCGRVIKYGNYEFDFKEKVFTSANIVNPNDNDVRGYFPNEQQEEYFGIVFYSITLPWMIEEPFPEEKTDNCQQINKNPKSIMKKISAWIRKRKDGDRI